MKKILFIVIFLISCAALSAQTGTGWTNMRAKYNFRDSVNINNGWKIGGTIVAPSITEINYVDGVTSAIQTQLNSVAGRIQDSIQRNALFTQDYYITEASGTVYAIPHPKTAYTATSDTNLTPVLQHCFDQGGVKVYIDEGTYDHMDNIIVKYDYTQVFGAGMYKTILKAKALIDNDVASDSAGYLGFFQVVCKDYFKLADIQLDGNGDNQRWIDDNDSFVMVGKSLGLYIGVAYTGPSACSDSSNYAVVENCYFHDWAGPAGIVLYSKNATIRDSRFVDCFSNGITVHGRNNIVEGCYFEGSGDVGCSLYGIRNKIINCEARDMDGLKGTTGSQWGFGIEGTHPSAIYGNSILNCKVSGYFKNGIYSYTKAKGTKISGNEVMDCKYAGGIGIGVHAGYGQEITNNTVHDFSVAGTGILCTSDTLTSVIGNKVIGLNSGNSYGISMSGSYLTSVLSNDVRIGASGGAGIYVNADYNKINGNTTVHTTVAGIYLILGADNNIVANNICTGVSANYDIYDLGTNNVKIDNYGTNKGNVILDRGINIVTPVTIKKIIGGVGVTGCDYNFTTAGDMNEQVIPMTSIVPAKSRILNVQTYTEATFTGATTLVAETGTASSSDDLIASATIYAVNAITATANGGVFIAVPSASAVSVYVSATPGANWSNVTAGKVAVYVTYLPYN